MIPSIRWGAELAVTVLTIASSKGGPGKTTVAALIVGSLAAEGLTVVALDADPTGALSRWAGSAPTRAPLSMSGTRRMRSGWPI